MAGKRQATSELNHDNWNQEDEPEERGTFKTASKDELKNRVIKKAKRNVVTGSTDAADSGSSTKSLFSGFSGFGKQASGSTSAGAAFSFLSKIPITTGTVSSSTATTTSTATFSFGTVTVSSAESTINAPKTSVTFASSSAPFANAVATRSAAANFSFGTTASTTATKDESSKHDDKIDDYHAKLMCLNQNVSAWIKTHVDKSPLCILTPIFRDYEKYLKELEDEKAKAETTEKKTSTTGSTNAITETFKSSDGNIKPSTTTQSIPSTFSFSPSTATSTSSASSLSKTNGFSFGLKKPDETKPAATTAPSSANFSFGLKSSAPSTSGTTTGFSFGSAFSSTQDSSATTTFSFASGAPTFSFANIKPPEATAATTDKVNDEDDEEPPKNEFKQVVEEDAVYSKKCKVFVKKDGNFVDKGVGTLYLKPIESTGKTQLIVRADTNLGNILVNLILSSGIPSKRMGKNNVMLVCVPTPEVEKPTPMLLRVKTGEEADDLLINIEKYKN